MEVCKNYRTVNFTFYQNGMLTITGESLEIFLNFTIGFVFYL